MDFCAEKSQSLAQQLRDRLNTPGQFSGYIGVRILSVGPEGALGELPVTPEVLNPRGIVHGGALATLADTVAGAAVGAVTGHTCVTASYGLSFLRQATGSKIMGKATPEKVGRRICVMHVDLTDDKNTKVATGEFTFCVMEPLTSSENAAH